MRALVIVPTYNELDNLKPIVDAILALPDVRMLVVDDDSPDGTGEAAESIAAHSGGRVSVLRRRDVRGLGRSYVAGMQVALRTDATHICQMDADFSHDPGDLPRLLSATERADLVLGSRYVVGGGVAANSRLRAEVVAAAEERGISAIVPDRGLCTDNAAMVGAAAHHQLLTRGPTALDGGIDPSLELPVAAG